MARRLAHDDALRPGIVHAVRLTWPAGTSTSSQSGAAGQLGLLQASIATAVGVSAIITAPPHTDPNTNQVRAELRFKASSPTRTAGAVVSAAHNSPIPDVRFSGEISVWEDSGADTTRDTPLGIVARNARFDPGGTVSGVTGQFVDDARDAGGALLDGAGSVLSAGVGAIRGVIVPVAIVAAVVLVVVYGPKPKGGGS